MKILIATPEFAPFAKVGGLGDMIRGLSIALARLGHHVKVVCPRYAFIDGPTSIHVEQVTLTFLEDHLHLKNPHVYPEGLEAKLRFQSFCEKASSTADSWTPDIIHCNDWMTSKIPTLTKFPTLLTIHNLMYQGVFDNENWLKTGIESASTLTTVSPNYAKEILTPTFGCGLHNLLQSKSITGILNGVDYDTWNPETDKLIIHPFSKSNLYGKSLCKYHIEKLLKLQNKGPIFSTIARMVDQKGLDKLANIIPSIIHEDIKFIIVGQGDPDIEQMFSSLQKKFPTKIAVHIGYNEQLSHQVEAASDFFIMPSRFEPCGLNQMYSMKYGAIPIVHAVGGLLDTVQDNVTGFTFKDDLLPVLYKALNLPENQYKTIQQNAMSQDFSWRDSAIKYLDLYNKTLNNHNHS